MDNLNEMGLVEIDNQEQKEVEGGFLPVAPIGIGIMRMQFDYISGVIEGFQDAVNN